MDVGWSGARWQTSNSCHLRNAFGFETPFSRDVLRPGIKISADIHGSIGSSPGAAPLMVSRSGRRQCSRTVTLLDGESWLDRTGEAARASPSTNSSFPCPISQRRYHAPGAYPFPSGWAGHTGIKGSALPDLSSTVSVLEPRLGTIDLSLSAGCRLTEHEGNL